MFQLCVRTCIVQVFPMKTIKDSTLSNYPLVPDVHLEQHLNVFVQTTTTLPTNMKDYKVLNKLLSFFELFHVAIKKFSFMFHKFYVLHSFSVASIKRKNKLRKEIFT